jgi:GDP-4-dehydro-6-deoxy-D-mannose reductase
MKRALITGFGGFAGGHLAEYLEAQGGWEVWGTTFHPAEAAPIGLEHVRAMKADLRRPEDARHVVQAAQPDVVFHLAGQAFVPQAWTDPWSTVETNLRGQLNVLDAVAGERPSARVVAVTSNEIYGAVRPDELPTDEDQPLRPTNPYGMSKAAQDLAAQMAHRGRGLDVIVIRPFTHVGPRQDRRFVTSDFASQVAEVEAGIRAPVIRVGDLTAERDFTDVRDIVRGYALAAERGSPGDVYNLGSGTSHAIADVVEFFVSRATVPIDVRPDLDRMRPSEIPRTLCDPTRAASRLGWSPAIRFDESLADVLEHWREAVRVASK